MQPSSPSRHPIIGAPVPEGYPRLEAMGAGAGDDDDQDQDMVEAGDEAGGHDGKL